MTSTGLSETAHRPVLRSFVAVELPERLRQEAAALARDLVGVLPGLRPVAAQNIHLTLRFLGELEADSCPPLSAALAHALQPLSPFSFQLGGLGVFPDHSPPRVLWLAVVDAAPLVALAARVAAACAGIGASEDRPFRPHLTIGRFRDRRSAADTRDLRERGASAFAKLEVRDVALFESRLGAGRAEHRVLGRFALAGAQ